MQLTYENTVSTREYVDRLQERLPAFHRDELIDLLKNQESRTQKYYDDFAFFRNLVSWLSEEEFNEIIRIKTKKWFDKDISKLIYELNNQKKPWGWYYYLSDSIVEVIREHYKIHWFDESDKRELRSLIEKIITNREELLNEIDDDFILSMMSWIYASYNLAIARSKTEMMGPELFKRFWSLAQKIFNKVWMIPNFENLTISTNRNWEYSRYIHLDQRKIRISDHTTSDYEWSSDEVIVLDNNQYSVMRKKPHLTDITLDSINDIVWFLFW